MRTNIKTIEYTRPEMKQVSLYGEGFICLSDELTVTDLINEGEEGFEM